MTTEKQFIAKAAPEEDEIDLLALVGALWRGKQIIAAAIAAAILIGGYYAYVMATPMYPATATIALRSQEQQIITDIESVLSGAGSDAATINTEAQVLRSRLLIGQLVDTLDLPRDPEFNSRLREVSWTTALRRSLTGAGDRPDPDPAQVRNEVIDRVLSRISVSNIRQSLAFNLSVTTTDPGKSALIANTLADLYIQNQILEKLEANTRAAEFLSTRTAELQQSVRTLENRHAAFSEQAELISQEVLEAQTLQLRDLRDRLEDQRRRATEETARLQGLLELREAGDMEALIATAGDTRLTRLLTNFRNGQISEIELAEQVDEVLEQLETEAMRAEQQIDALEGSEQTLAAQIQRQSEELIELQQLEREVEAARLLYQSFFTRLQETNVQQGLETADSRLLSEAVPRAASSPRKSMILALSAVLGGMLGAGIVLLREMRFAGFRTADELRNFTHRKVLASIPMIPRRDRSEVIDYLRDKPNSVVAEAIRNLRTSVLMSNIDNPPQVIMFTSSVPGEGKTTISLGMGRNMAGMGKRVLLIEADIRRRTFGAYFDTESMVPLLDLMTQETLPETRDPFVEELGIDILVGSESDVNAVDIFASERFAKVIAELRQHYDYIIIDTPPVLAVPDARVIASNVDALVYVVEWNSTTRTQVNQGLEMLENVDLEVTGLVLGKIDQRKMRSYGYGGQYGYDSYGSGYYNNQ